MKELDKKTLARKDLNLLVEASAGTGKTSSLLDRILALIEQDKELQMRQLVAVTFTEKAASELKNRLRQCLQEKINSKKISSQRLQVFKQALSDFEQAEISTIHSFCARLLRLRSVEAGVSPEFQVMDEAQSAEFFEQAWEEWLEKSLVEHREIFRELRQAGITNDIIKTFAQRFYEDRDLFEANYENWLKEKSLSVEEAYQQIKVLCQNTSEDELKEFYLFLESCANEEERLKRAIYQKELKRIINRRNNLLKGLKRVKTESTIQKKLKIIEAYDHFLAIIYNARNALFQKIVFLAREFFDHLEIRKLTNEVLDFQDLLLRARNLLRDNKEVRAYFKNRFRYILVDEFQDTDPLQVEVIFFLAEKKDKFADSWKDVELESGKLFLVGDPKQSIYHFRRADLRIYQAVKNILDEKKQADLRFLPQNFRSHKSLIKWVNDTFKEKFGDEDTPLQPAYQELSHTVDYSLSNQLLDRSVIIIDLEEEPDIAPSGAHGYRTDDIRQLEARAIADFIQWAVANKIQIFEKDQTKWEKRDVRYSDFAILYPRHKYISFVEAELKRRNLPFETVSGEAFNAREEVKGICFILKALSNPYDEASLVGALRSFYFGVSDFELFEFKKAGGSWRWLEHFPDRERFPTIAEAYDFLRHLYNQVERLPIVELINQIASHIKLKQIRKLHPYFNQILLNIERMKNLACEFEKLGEADLDDFIYWLEKVSAGEAKEAEIVAVDAENTIKLMTFHKAKGLEFPIVILANLSNQIKSSEENFIIKDWKRERIEVFYKKRLKSSGFDELSEEEEKYNEAEQIRLLYVACTRAKQYLVIPDPKNLWNGRNTYLEIIKEGISKEDKQSKSKCILRKPASELRKYRTIEQMRAFVDFINLSPQSTQLEKQVREFEEKRSEVINIASEYKEIKSPSELIEFEEKIPYSTERLQALDLGSLIHKVVEIAGRSSVKVALALADRLISENPSLSEKREEIMELIKNLWQCELIDKIQNLACWQEVPFFIELDGVFYKGKIDLLFRHSANQLEMVDLKTDHLSQETISTHINRYKGQMEIYRRALEKLFPNHSISSKIFFARINELVEIKK